MLERCWLLTVALLAGCSCPDLPRADHHRSAGPEPEIGADTHAKSAVDTETVRWLQMDEVPYAILEIARAALPGVELESATVVERDGDAIAYTLTGVLEDEEYEIEIIPGGEREDDA